MGNIIINEQKLPVEEQSKKMAWLIIQCSDSCDEDGDWVNLFPEDVPDWVKDEDCISKMMEGKMVSAAPDKGAKWYRAVRCEKPTVS